MKKVKLNFALLAMILGISAALAFKAPETKTNAAVWRRIATSGTAETSNSWSQGNPLECQEATSICSASFEDGYNPNQHSLEDNEANALEGTETFGYSVN